MGILILYLIFLCKLSGTPELSLPNSNVSLPFGGFPGAALY